MDPQNQIFCFVFRKIVFPSFDVTLSWCNENVNRIIPTFYLSMLHFENPISYLEI